MAGVALSVEGLARHVGGAFGTLQEGLSPDNAPAFFAGLGLAFPASFSTNAAVRPALEAASSAAGALKTKAEELGTAIDGDAAAATIIGLGAEALIALGTGIDRLGDLRTAIQAQSGGLGLPQPDVQAFAAELPSRLLAYAVTTYAEARIFRFVNLLSLFGVVERKTQAAVVASGQPSAVFVSRRLAFQNLGKLLRDPLGLLRDLYGFGGPSFGDPDAAPAVSGEALLLALIDFLYPLGYYGKLDTDTPELPVLESYLFAFAISPRLSPPGVELRAKIDLAEVASFSDELVPGWTVSSSVEGSWSPGVRLTIQPTGEVTAKRADGAPLTTRVSFAIEGTPQDRPAFDLVGITGGAVIQARKIAITPFLEAGGQASAALDPGISLGIEGGRVIVDLASGDGFLSSLTGGEPIEADFELSATYTFGGGFRFDAGSSFGIKLPLHVSFAGVDIDGLSLSVPLDEPGGGIPIDFATAIRASLGPIDVVVDQVGLSTQLSFPPGGGRLGVADFSVGFKAPTGLGISVDAGGVAGGGFLSFDSENGRYMGVLELRVFAVSVKAFGLVETKFPDGRDGFSFVMVISAEFTPVQLSFGFTLNGVGGLVGVNRGLVAEALGDAVRRGSLNHLLFPEDPVRDAPTILNDLQTIFPASPKHFVFGPMAKIGWGTPTLITADLGIIIEFPGPRLAVIGVAHAALPTRQFSILRLNLAIAGVLDFPKRTFALDASIYDSLVGGFSVSGDASFRLSFGDRPNFALSVGGFNPSFKPPPSFPTLRRVSVDLGVNGNPSLTLQGYFALTSNTAQVGAAISLRASGAGIRLEGHLSFDALFVFSPFSFEAELDAGVRVSFHGVGIGVHLHGHLSGPTPWRVRGDVCVSILWWDACLGFDASFGKKRRAELPPIDPWDPAPQNSDPELPVVGLFAATEDARNWAGEPPPAAFSVVTLAARDPDEPPPLDPLGAATFRQKVVPLSQKITKFGAFKPVVHDRFHLSALRIGSVSVDLARVSPVNDDFAPAQFKEMKASERLSAPAYEEMEAGFTVDPRIVHVGVIAEKQVEFETELLDGNRQPVGNEPNFKLTARHLQGMLRRSAAALGGIRSAGPFRYAGTTKIRISPERFGVADRCSREAHPEITAGLPRSFVQTSLALEDHVNTNPDDAGRFAIVPSWETGT